MVLGYAKGHVLALNAQRSEEPWHGTVTAGLRRSPLGARRRWKTSATSGISSEWAAGMASRGPTATVKGPVPTRPRRATASTGSNRPEPAQAHPDVVTWTEAVAHWEQPLDSADQSRWLNEKGVRLCQWTPAPFETSPTDCFKVDQIYWLWQAGVGGIRFTADLPEFFAFPCPDVEPGWFAQVVTRSWLPAIYQFWGRQVVHASAVAREEGGDVVAFVGPSGAGKSTVAYGLGRRTGWQMVADDTLAFSRADGRLALHPFRQETRLRPATVGHYGVSGEGAATLPWPSGNLTLVRLYCLGVDLGVTGATYITPLTAAETYRLVLEQAFALSLNIPEHNRELMLDYATLAAVPSFRLDYRRSFDVIERVLDDLEAHVVSTVTDATG